MKPDKVLSMPHSFPRINSPAFVGRVPPDSDGDEFMNVAILVFLYRVVQILISKYIYVSDSVVRLIVVRHRLRLWNICILRILLAWEVRTPVCSHLAVELSLSD